MKVLRYGNQINHKVLKPLAEAHLRNYGIIYCDKFLDPMEIEDVEEKARTLSYKDVGWLADLLEEKLKHFFSEKGLSSKNIWINSLTIKDGLAEITVDSDYFDGRVGYRISMENGLKVSMCPWADEDFSKPFIEAFEEWINGDAVTANHYRYLER